MKKLFLIGIAATAMLVSCSNDEAMETAQPTTEAIGFNAFVNKSTRGGVSTRGIANDITNDGTNGTTAFKDFKVWGWMKKVGENAATVFTGTKVSKQTDGSWKYDIGNTPIQYWEPGYNYKFTAIAPDATNITFVAPDADASWENYGSIQFNNGVDTDQSKTAGTTDLIWDIDGEWATKVIPTDVCPAPIAFTFKHLLSRVKFQFVSEYLDGSQMNVTDVKITNANVKATATLNSDETATWAIDNDNTPSRLDFGNVLLTAPATTFGADITVETDHKYMIPVLATDQVYTVSFTLTRTFSNGVEETYPYSVNLPTVTWESGHSYAFIAKFKPNCPIEFTATVTPWEDFNDPATDLFPEDNTGTGSGETGSGTTQP